MEDLRYPLLPEQARFLTRNLAHEHHWNLTGLFRIPPALTQDMLAAAVRHVVNRHDALRTHLLDADRETWGAQEPAVAKADVMTFDLSDLPAAEQPAAVTERCADLQVSMSMTQGPLFRVAHFHLSGDERRALLILHHFVCDGLSLQIVVKELEQACLDLLAGRDPSAATSPGSATAFARWLRGLAGSEKLRSLVPRWQEIGRPAEPVPLDLPGENTFATESFAAGRLDQSTTRRFLREFLPAHGLDVQQACLTATVGALHGSGKHSVQAVLIGHGRHGLPGQPNVTRTVGWLATAHPVSLHLDTATGFDQQLAVTREVFRQIPHAGASFGVLRFMSQDQQVRQSLGALDRPALMVNYLGRMTKTPSASLLAAAPESPGVRNTRIGERSLFHGIDVYVSDGELSVEWYYSSNQYRASTVQGYLDSLLDRIRHGLDG